MLGLKLIHVSKRDPRGYVRSFLNLYMWDMFEETQIYNDVLPPFYTRMKRLVEILLQTIPVDKKAGKLQMIILSVFASMGVGYFRYFFLEGWSLGYDCWEQEPGRYLNQWRPI